MSEHAITPEMIEAGARKLAGQDMREDGFSERAALDAEKGDMWRNFKAFARVAWTAMESARLEGEEAARQERMKAREVAR